MARVRKLSSIQMDRGEEVYPWIAEQVLATRRSDRRIRWLTGPRAAWRFTCSPFAKRDPPRGGQSATASSTLVSVKVQAWPGVP